MKKCSFVTIFLIVNLFFLHSKNLSGDSESREYSPYSYDYPTYSLFPSEDDNKLMSTPFSEEKFDYPVDYNSINYNLTAANSGISAQGLPPGFENYDGIGTELPVGNLIPLILFSGIYIFRIILKKTQQNLLHN